MSTTERPPFEFLGNWDGQFIATAIHTGHDVRPDFAAELILPEADRLREEDPHTDEIGALIPARVIVNRSRFEVDLNRTREESVYRTSEEAWGLDVVRNPPLDEAVVAGSLAVYDAFYAELGRRLDTVADRGPFVLFDVHSYNHRRDGADAAPAADEESPEVNVGTGSVDHERFGPVVETFMRSLRAAETSTGPLDVRENVRFRGRQLAAWTHARYPGRGLVLALEFKKTFMDEWTGEVDQARIDELARALAGTLPAVESSLRQAVVS
ncbi:N-formylglutamate amidohydrolase [Microterricola pindariensis]|uniref:N-formylglutamate amidohydrolase n=1 Tax=Microterricola pindariensis TaxID=478010 RepID=A0ABX5AZB2_9MICO|nr:N-formylglutamate amidohydrolase [Microterricola pindariensis]PPL20247.1 N-formylglutamate amidohydrolase [Microterricola pindariensis]